MSEPASLAEPSEVIQPRPLPDYMQIRERPKGVLILGVLQLLGGIGAGAFLALNFSRLGEVGHTLRPMDIQPWTLVAGIGLLIVLAVGAGIGMLAGAKWGWWFAAIWYAYSITRAANALVFASHLADKVGEPAESVNIFYAKFVGRIVVGLLLLAYLFRDRVLRYFGLAEIKKGHAMMTLVAVCAAIWLAFNVPTLFMGR